MSSPETVTSHNMKIDVDVKNHTIDVVDKLITNVQEKNEVKFSIHKNVSIKKIRVRGEKDLHYFVRDGSGAREVTVLLPHNRERIVEIEIHYTGRFPDLPEDIKFSREFLSEKPVVYTGEEITLLDGSACWYPCTDGFAAFNVTTNTPSGYEVIMEGTRLSREEKKGVTSTSWEFPHPVASIYLVGGRYVINEDRYNNISIYTYFFAEDAGLSQSYIDYCKRYLELYEGLFGQYPFRKFAVVENVLPTGFGMPSYTLLGQSVLRLPFMVKTSLGHEIAHNWWGNYVYPDYEKGNWSEGLTTYIADHLYEEKEGRGASYRNQLLRDYTNFTDQADEYPLKKFVRRENPADRAIGYGKGAYIFHMLRMMLGDDAFYKGLRGVIAERGFKVAAWDDFKSSFEKVSGKDLSSFFRQWVENVGAPQIMLGDVRLLADEHGKGYIIKTEVIQEDKPFEIYLPVSLETEDGVILSQHWIKGASITLELHASSKPLSLTIDPDYDVFRRLNQNEIPPTIGRYLGGQEKWIVVQADNERDRSAAYKRAAEILEGGVKIYNPPLPESVRVEDDAISIKGKVYARKDAVLAVALESPYSKDAVVIYLSGHDPEDIVSVAARLTHYGKYSYLLFINDENVEKGIWEAGKLGRAFNENY